MKLSLRWIPRWAVILGLAYVAMATLILVLSALSSAWNEIAAAPGSSWPWLLGSLALMSASNIGVGAIWVYLLQNLESSPIQGGALLRFFLVTWPGRYVPGTVPYHATRVLLAERFGAAKTAVAASVAYEAVLQAGAAGLVGVAGTATALGVSRSIGSGYFLAVIPIALLPLLLRPAILLPAMNRLLKLARREAVPHQAVLSTHQTSTALLAYSLVYIINGVAFYLVLRALVGGEVSVWLAVGAYNVAGAAGLAAIFVPSGIGVREAVIVALLSSTIEPEQALLAAGAARAVSVVADLIPLGGMLILDVGRHASRRPSGQRSELPSTPESV